MTRAAILLLLCLLAGCASVQPRETLHNVSSLKVHLCNEARLQQLFGFGIYGMTDGLGEIWTWKEDCNPSTMPTSRECEVAGWELYRQWTLGYRRVNDEPMYKLSDGTRW